MTPVFKAINEPGYLDPKFYPNLLCLHVENVLGSVCRFRSPICAYKIGMRVHKEGSRHVQIKIFCS